jgi:hypothetical protein
LEVSESFTAVASVNAVFVHTELLAIEGGVTPAMRYLGVQPMRKLISETPLAAHYPRGMVSIDVTVESLLRRE